MCTRGDRIANARREKAPPPVLTPAGLGLAGPHSSPPGGPANPPCVPRQMSLNIKADRIHLGPSARLPSLVLWGGGSRPSVEQLRGVRGPARGRRLPLPREAVKPPAPFRGAGTKRKPQSPTRLFQGGGASHSSKWGFPASSLPGPRYPHAPRPLPQTRGPRGQRARCRGRSWRS